MQLSQRRKKKGVPLCYQWDPISPFKTPVDYHRRLVSTISIRAKYDHALLRFQLEFHADSSWTEVKIYEPCKLSSRSQSQVKIPQEYQKHLTWITHESMGESDQAKWLQNVLDCFAEELNCLPPDFNPSSSWRSHSLNCLIFRAYYGVDSLDKEQVEIKARARVDPASSHETPLNAQQWLQFYTQPDVILDIFDGHWLSIKPHGFPLIKDIPTAAASDLRSNQALGMSEAISHK